jgi:formylglycine-generating enzyme required for sulfatase activity
MQSLLPTLYLALILTIVGFACKGGGSDGRGLPTANGATDKNTFQLPGDVTLELVSIPKGTFMMGRDSDLLSEENPQHQVTIGQDFYMAKFETTQAQWLAIMGSNPSRFRDKGYGPETDDFTRPVDSVSWNDIRAPTTGFLDKLNAATEGKRPAGMVFRLPTEAEWEYANFAGATTRFYWGDDPNYSEINDYAWYHGNGGETTHGTGELKLPNAFGLYNISGNVSEWCEDDYMMAEFEVQNPGNDYNATGFDKDNGSPIPVRPDDGSAWKSDPRAYRRVRRDCSWFDSNSYCRGTKRTPAAPHAYGDSWGFRVVLGAP